MIYHPGTTMEVCMWVCVSVGLMIPWYLSGESSLDSIYSWSCSLADECFICILCLFNQREVVSVYLCFMTYLCLGYFLSFSKWSPSLFLQAVLNYCSYLYLQKVMHYNLYVNKGQEAVNTWPVHDLPPCQVMYNSIKSDKIHIERKAGVVDGLNKQDIYPGACCWCQMWNQKPFFHCHPWPCRIKPWCADMSFYCQCHAKPHWRWTCSVVGPKARPTG